MSDDDRAQLEAKIEGLRDQVAAPAVEIDRLTRLSVELTRRLDQGSKNSPSIIVTEHRSVRPGARVGR